MEIRKLPALVLALLPAAMPAGAQMMIETDPLWNSIFWAKNTGTVAADGIGLRGESKPTSSYGIGVLGEGGFKGVMGQAIQSGSGQRYGGYFQGSGGSTTNYGVWASATGGTANYAGYFSGNVHVTGVFTNPSDERLKREIAPVQGALGKVLALRAASYRYDNSVLPVEGLAEGRQYGLMAGDVGRVLPELVKEIPIPKGEADRRNGTEADAETFSSVNYIGLIPVLVAAIQEQNAEIKALKAALGRK